MLCPGIGFARPSVAELADARPEDQRAGETRERSLVVHDGRAGEVLHAPGEEPAVRAPDPVRDDRVRDREPDAEDEVDPELRALGHRAPDDRERDAREHDLEQVAGRARDLREEVERLLADGDHRVDRREEAGRAAEPAAVAERDPEADHPVDDRAEPEDQDVLAGDVAGVLHPRQPRLEEGEAGLHEHHEDRRDDDPDRARRDQQILVLDCCCDHPTSTSSRLQTCSVVRDVLDGRRPDEPVARLVAAACGGRDRRDDRFGLLVVDDEDEQRLRQEARLEHAPAVLVRDAALAPVPDRLDHRDADVARLLLDGVDHGLDPLADDNCLDLRHPTTSDRRSSNNTSRQTPFSSPMRSRTPTSRKPQPRWRRRLALFSGKIPACSVQIPAASRERDQRFEQRPPDAPALRPRGDVDTVLGDAAVAAAIRVRHERRPAGHLAVEHRDEPVLASAPRPTTPTTARRSRTSRCPFESRPRRSRRPPASPVAGGRGSPCA